MSDTVATTERFRTLPTTPLLRTKLFIPQARRLQGILSRPRLVERLQAGLTRQLTLISAPAGYGKTVLLTEWIPQSPRCVCWLSLDETDNDIACFLTYFIAALQMLKADFGQTLQALAQQENANLVDLRNTQGEILTLRALITTYALHFDLAQVYGWGQEALAALHPDNTPFRGVVLGALGSIALYQGDLVRAEAIYAEASKLSLDAGNVYVRLAATGRQITMQQARGVLGVAITTCEQFLDWVRNDQAAADPLIGVIYANLADLLRERNDLVTALHYANTAVERCAYSSHAPLLLISYVALSRIKQAQGRWAEALAALQQLRHRLEPPPPWLRTLLPAVEAQLHLAQGNLPAALAWSLPADWEEKLLRPFPFSHVFTYAYGPGARQR